MQSSICLTGILLVSTVLASSFSPARPPAIPLAVRSPYLSAWLPVDTNGGGNLAGNWPRFWNGQIVGWTGLIRVDGQTYTWMGKPPSAPPAVQQTSFEYTSTRSIFKQTVNGLVDITVTFLSPITPTDFKRASLTSSYMQVEVASADGKAHSVQIYTDISAEWVSGDRTANVKWDYGTIESSGGCLAYHHVRRRNELQFSEVSDQTEYGDWYYMTANTTNLSHRSGEDVLVRSQFVDSGRLDNTADRDFRPINDQWPVFGYAIDLGSIHTDAASRLFTINLNQHYAMQFLGGQKVEPQCSLWTSYFPKNAGANAFFFADYQQATSLAIKFDDRVMSDSVAAGGANYALITTLAVRQAFGSIQLTGTPSDPLIFLKEISSDGNVNTVDVIFPWMPIALYSNPTLLKYILEPLLINQETSNWPFAFSIHDIGTNYPNATGHTNGQNEQQPLEECGDMIIMSLAYAQRTNDNSWLAKHYRLLNQWVGYLIQEALIPMNQISTDDFAGPLANQTNLALKGIIGIQAMAEIASRTGQHSDAVKYAATASDYIKKWEVLATTEGPCPHTTLNYGNSSSFSLLYNLWAAPLLSKGSFVPKAVYDRQSNFYSRVAHEYGVPLDTRHTYTKLDWQLFCAAIAQPKTKQFMVDLVASFINNSPTAAPLTDLYDANTADWPVSQRFTARPVVGGAFALLALPKGSVPS